MASTRTMTCNCMSWTLNQPEIVVQQALTGTFADGLGKVQHVPDRVSFAPMPWGSFANDVDYATIARQVYLATDARVATRDAGMEVPKASGRTPRPRSGHDERCSLQMRFGEHHVNALVAIDQLGDTQISDQRAQHIGLVA
jgi:hypothetical protein